MIELFELIRPHAGTLAFLLVIALGLVSVHQARAGVKKIKRVQFLRGGNQLSNEELMIKHNSRRTKFYFLGAIVLSMLAPITYLVLNEIGHPLMDNTTFQGVLYVLVPILILYFLIFASQSYFEKK